MKRKILYLEIEIRVSTLQNSYLMHAVESDGQMLGWVKEGTCPQGWYPSP